VGGPWGSPQVEHLDSSFSLLLLVPGSYRYKMFLLFSCRVTFEYRVNLVRKKKEEGQKHDQKGLSVTMRNYQNLLFCRWDHDL
jgi:hypothetical protein